MDPSRIPVELFPHVRIVMGMVVGLSITRLLTGVATFIQHPGRNRPYAVHLLWAATLLLELIHFWWWQYALYGVENWTFILFVFLIGYAIILYFMCALLFPDNVTDFGGYEGYFISRRGWFFTLFASTFICDLIDSAIKGPAYFARFGYEYYIQVPIGLIACMIAVWTTNRLYHTAFVSVHLAYQLWWIWRLFYAAPVSAFAYQGT